MSELLETITYRKYPIEIYYDDMSTSPNDWGDDEQFLVFDQAYIHHHVPLQNRRTLNLTLQMNV